MKVISTFVKKHPYNDADFEWNYKRLHTFLNLQKSDEDDDNNLHLVITIYQN